MMVIKKYPQYKESGIEWIGEIPKHWSTLRFKINFSYIKGKNPTKIYDEKKENLVPYLSMEYLRNMAKPKYVSTTECNITANNDELLLLWDGSNAGEFVISKKGSVSSTMVKITPNTLMNNRYSQFLCKSIEPLIRHLTIGMGVPHVSSEKLNNIIIPKIHIDEQEQIAKYLDTKTTKIQKTITKNKQLITLLKEKRTTLINQTVTKGLNPETPMKETGIEWIGKIPEHWNLSKIKHELKFLDYKRIPLSAEERSNLEKKYDYYGASGIIDKVDDYIFEGTYILIGEDGANLLYRNLPLAFLAKGKFWVNNHAHILDVKKGNITYFMYLLEQVDYTNYITGSAQPKLSADNLKNIQIIKPPVEEQKNISEYLDEKIGKINQTIQKIEKNIELLEEYKDSLIHHVVTGKIDVRGVEV